VAGTGHDYQVGPNSGQLASLDVVPWESLAAGDTVRIYYRATPYKGKFLIAAQGTAVAPVRICGVKGPNGERPIIDGNGATTRTAAAFASLYGSTTSCGTSCNGQSPSDIYQNRAVIVLKASPATYTGYPTYIQIDGLQIRGAASGYPFTDASGSAKTYAPAADGSFGACIWIDRGQNITIANNEINDCTNGLYSKSLNDGDFAVTKNIRVAGNYIHGNGVVGDEHQHNSYMESVNIVYEYNRYGAPRSGALGNAIKDRSVGTVVRFNRIEEGAHAIDLVEAEDFQTIATTMAAYRTTFVYGNQIVKNGDSGSFIHYGGDHYGGTPTTTITDMTWGEPIFRKGTLYFFNNTIYATGGAVQLFQLSTTQESAQVWNNIFYCDASVAVGYCNMRATSEVGSAWTPGGVVNLDVNWINTSWSDSDPYHAVPGTLSGQAKLITGTTAPISLTTLIPVAGSAVIDKGIAGPSAASAYSVNAQLSGTFLPATRPVNGAAIDLGAIEK
jgi:hypothetical protein